MPSPQGPHPATALPAPDHDQLAEQLCAALAQGHQIPAYQVALGDHTVVSLWYGLTARCAGGRIWWTYWRGNRAVLTFAWSPVTAAARLAQLYAAAVRPADSVLDQPPSTELAGPPQWSMEAAAAQHLAARERP
ncbi:hypothetical protein [Nonomuraea sp. NPDC050786]|uniref:hypothetical protein n=1 Tax=Nonomuraea sp. NPDC050786 TaxID=3154840 RepID=UPI0033C3002A